jgi:translation initiation factor IF-1
MENEQAKPGKQKIEVLGTVIEALPGTQFSFSFR